jgi:hypothetical protein
VRLIRNRWNNQLEHTLKSVDRQEKSLLGDFTPIADFRLKCCIKEQKSKKKLTRKNCSERWDADSTYKCRGKGCFKDRRLPKVDMHPDFIEVLNIENVLIF